MQDRFGECSNACPQGRQPAEIGSICSGVKGRRSARSTFCSRMRQYRQLRLLQLQHRGHRHIPSRQKLHTILWRNRASAQRKGDTHRNNTAIIYKEQGSIGVNKSTPLRRTCIRHIPTVKQMEQCRRRGSGHSSPRGRRARIPPEHKKNIQCRVRKTHRTTRQENKKSSTMRWSRSLICPCRSCIGRRYLHNRRGALS